MLAAVGVVIPALVTAVKCAEGSDWQEHSCCGSPEEKDLARQRVWGCPGRVRRE